MKITNMKKKIAIVVAVAFSAGAAFEASALTSSDSAKAFATLKIYQRIKITKNRDLRFGDALQGDATTLTVAADDNDKSAKFDVVGIPNTPVSIGLDKTAVDVVKLDQSGNPILIPNTYQTLRISGVAASAQGNTDASGNFSIFVGGTRPIIPAQQEAGNYSGDFTVTVSQSN